MATIRKRGNSYQIRASAGYDIDGQQIVKAITWKPQAGLTAKQIEKELNIVTVDFERKVENGQCIDSTIRFADYAAIWLKKGEENGEKPLAPKTLDRYRALLVRINAAIGHIRLCDLQPHHIREFLDNLKEEGIRDDIKYTATINLPTLLKKQGLTRKALANATGLAISTAYVACRGKSVTKGTAESICEALKLKLNIAFTANTADSKLADKTVLYYYRLISAILNGAVMDDQALLLNPAKRVRSPHCGSKEELYLDEVQAAHMIELLEHEPVKYKTMVLLLLYSGMRRGELCGLEWKDVDFKNHLISIQRTSQYTPKKGIFVKGTKTASSIRTIKLPTVAIDLLRKYRKEQTKQRLSMGDQWKDSDRLYTAWNGQPAHPDSLTSWFEDFIKRTDLPQIHIHSLRHTNATLQIAGGVPLTTVAGRLGHASEATTGKIYAHAIQSADARAADTLENILRPMDKRA